MKRVAGSYFSSVAIQLRKVFLYLKMQPTTEKEINQVKETTTNTKTEK